MGRSSLSRPRACGRGRARDAHAYSCPRGRRHLGRGGERTH
jgi:hypothetical protein